MDFLIQFRIKFWVWLLFCFIGHAVSADLQNQNEKKHSFDNRAKLEFDDLLVSPDNGSGQKQLQFGAAVAIEEDVAVVGAWGYRFGEINRGAVYVFKFDGQDWVETQILLASDGVQDDRFGEALSLSGDTLVIGAQYNEGEYENSGSAYVFTYNGSTWVESTKLTAPIEHSNSFFGRTVNVGENRILVGAPGDIVSGVRQGSLYVYEYDGKSWGVPKKLTANDGQEFDRFGEIFDQSTDRIIVGTPNSDIHGENLGGAYVFEYDGVNWLQTRKLFGSSSGLNPSEFGYDVAVNADTIMVSAPSNTPSVFVFNHNGLTWDLSQELMPTNSAYSVEIKQNKALIGQNIFEFDGNVWLEVPNTEFGDIIDFYNGLLIRGSRFIDLYGHNSGRANIYKRLNSQPYETTSLYPKDWSFEDRFGTRVAISGNKAIIGAPYDDDMHIRDSGAIYFFKKVLGIWEFSQKIKTNPPLVEDYFGLKGVEIFDNRLFITSDGGDVYFFEFSGQKWEQKQKISPPVNHKFRDNFGRSIDMYENKLIINGDNYSEVYMYHFDGTQWILVDQFSGLDTVPDDHFGYSLSIYENIVVVGARFDDDRGNASGSVYIFEFNGQDWIQTNKIIRQDGYSGQLFGYQVDLEGDNLLVGATSSYNDPILKTGKVFSYKIQNGFWEEQFELKASDEDPNIFNYFGLHLYQSTQQIVIGGQNSIYIFDLLNNEWVERIIVSGNFDNRFGSSIDVSGDHVLIGAPLDDTIAKDSGMVFSYSSITGLIFKDGFEKL